MSKKIRPPRDGVALLHSYKYVLNHHEFALGFVLQDSLLAEPIKKKVVSYYLRNIDICKRQIELLNKRFSAMIV